MKSLCIIRHAKTVDRDFGLADFDRYLMARGRHDAERMSRRLRTAGFTPDCLISSRARRAMETAEIFAAAYGIDTERIIMSDALYNAGDGDDVLHVVRELANGDAVAVFGHDPAFTDAVQTLASEFRESMPTCGVALCELRIDAWEELGDNDGNVVHWDFPKNVELPEPDLSLYDQGPVLDKKEYRALKDALRERLGQLQRQAKDSDVPVIIVVEGWHGAGKGTQLNKLLLAMDPRSFTLYKTGPPTEEESFHPFLWPFWCRTPKAGTITVFDQCWYHRLLSSCVTDDIAKRQWRAMTEAVNVFERQLTEDGTVIVKFFLNITQKEQQTRFEELESDGVAAWRVTPSDRRQNRNYDRYHEATGDLLAATHSETAPWTVIDAKDRRHTTVRVFQTLINALERRLARPPSPQPRRLATLPASALGVTPLHHTLARDEYNKQLESLQERLATIGLQLYRKRVPVVIAYEGRDAAGKGGSIRRLAASLDPRGYDVVPIGAPTDVERSHHYLWRFWNEMPKAGHLTIFDRSWYGRVLVERVEGFCDKADWQRAFQEINEMEEHLASYPVVIFKFWLQIDADEQMRRFQARGADPNKHWKITDEDWRNREKWDAYTQAADEMLFRTHTKYAPWTIVQANCKHFARVHVLRTIVERLEEIV